MNDMYKYKISVISLSIRPEGLKQVRDALLKQTLKDFEWLVEVNWTGEVDFNASMNRALKRAQGELVVSVQDFITLPPNGLELFWNAHKEKPAFYTAPVGQTLDDKDITWDWRVHRNTECSWQEWEIDYGSAPLQALKDIGGFDEELDKAWGFDNVNVGLRAQLAGYDFGCLKENRAIALRHDDLMEHPFRKLRDSDLHNARLADIRHGRYNKIIFT